MIKYTILIRITLFQISDKGEDVCGWMDAVLYMLASDHVLEAKEDELGEFFNLIFLLSRVSQGVYRGVLLSKFYLSSYFNVHPCTYMYVHYTASRRGQKLNFKNSPP